MHVPFYAQITQLGKDFAAKYTGLEDSLSAQVSLVKLKIQQKSLHGLLQYGLALVPAIKRYVKCIRIILCVSEEIITVGHRTKVRTKQLHGRPNCS